MAWHVHVASAQNKVIVYHNKSQQTGFWVATPMALAR